MIQFHHRSSYYWENKRFKVSLYVIDQDLFAEYYYDGQKVDNPLIITQNIP